MNLVGSSSKSLYPKPTPVLPKFPVPAPRCSAWRCVGCGASAHWAPDIEDERVGHRLDSSGHNNQVVGSSLPVPAVMARSPFFEERLMLKHLNLKLPDSRKPTPNPPPPPPPPPNCRATFISDPRSPRPQTRSPNSQHYSPQMPNISKALCSSDSWNRYLHFKPETPSRPSPHPPTPESTPKTKRTPEHCAAPPTKLHPTFHAEPFSNPSDDKRPGGSSPPAS